MLGKVFRDTIWHHRTIPRAADLSLGQWPSELIFLAIFQASLPLPIDVDIADNIGKQLLLRIESFLLLQQFQTI